MVPVRVLVEMAGRDAERFLVYAVAQPVGTQNFDLSPGSEAPILFLPAGRGELPGAFAVPVGTSCRICPREACPVRREPSILAQVA